MADTPHCADCGNEYGGPYFPDLIVPHDVWNVLSPTGDEGGLLCPSCLCAAAEKHGVECHATFRSGPFFDDREKDADPLVDALRNTASGPSRQEHVGNWVRYVMKNARAALAAWVGKS